MRTHLLWFIILMMSMSSDVNAITHSDSYLFDLSLALQSCNPNISYYKIDLPVAVDSGNANHEPTSEFCTHNSQWIRSLMCPDLDRLLPSPLSEGLSLLPPSFQSRTFLSERNSFGSVDWPPIVSSLLPGRRRDNDIGVQVSDVTPKHRSVNLPTKTEESGGDSIILDQETSLSPFHESEQVLDRRK
jgi:hypothetical protein